MNTISKYLNLLLAAFEIIFFQLISVFYQNQKKYKNLWLFCERGYDAQDNAWAFFQYIQSKFPDQNKAFLLNSKSSELAQKIEKVGQIILYKSFQHKMAFTLCAKSLSTHIGFVEPWNHKLYKLLTIRKQKYVFLQHGVIYNDLSKYLKKSISGIDAFIVSTNMEYENIFGPKYQFNEKEVKLTGLARFDNLYKNKDRSSNEILFMPTWRRELTDEKKFQNSAYFKNINSFLRNENLLKLLNHNDLQLNFVLHPEFQKYINQFVELPKRINLIDIQNVVLQDLIIDSKLLITDYSSVFFDFIYMEKPILFFELDDFQNYTSEDFDRSNFGEICEDKSQLISALEKCIQGNFKNSKSRMKNDKSFFVYHDDQNCKRIYQNIT